MSPTIYVYMFILISNCYMIFFKIDSIVSKGDRKEERQSAEAPKIPPKNVIHLHTNLNDNSSPYSE